MKTLYYIVGLAGAIVGTDYALRKFNDGKGLFTSTEYMAEFVRQNGRNNPNSITKEDFLSFFKKLGKGFRTTWFKACNKNIKESFPSFEYEGKRYATKGGIQIG